MDKVTRNLRHLPQCLTHSKCSVHVTVVVTVVIVILLLVLRKASLSLVQPLYFCIYFWFPENKTEVVIKENLV